MTHSTLSIVAQPYRRTGGVVSLQLEGNYEIQEELFLSF